MLNSIMLFDFPMLVEIKSIFKFKGSFPSHAQFVATQLLQTQADARGAHAYT